MKRWFKTNFINNILLLLGYGLINVLIFVLFIVLTSFFRSDSVYSSRVTLDEIEEALKDSEMLTEIQDQLLRNDSFYLVIDNDGNISQSFNLPHSLDHSYSRAEIASFSRWYLDDYPVNTRILEDNSILVEGFPKESLVKYSLTLSRESVAQDIIFIPFLFLVNSAIFIFIFRRQQKNIQAEIEPILEGVEDLSHGKIIHLDEKGSLVQVKSDLNTLSKHLREREDLRTEWISEVSHDIRTPLSVIATSSELLERSSGGSNDNTERIRSNVIKIRTLVDSLNINNRLEFGLSPINKTEENFTELIRETIINFINENDLSKFPLSVDLDRSVEEARLMVDKYLFNRVVANLLSNCVIHNPEGVEIFITLTREKDHLILKFENEKRQDIQVNDSYDHGQGLKFIRKFTDLHEWGLKIDSGEDFEVTFIIPT